MCGIHLHVFTYLVLQPLYVICISLTPFIRGGNGGRETLSDLPVVIQLVSDADQLTGVFNPSAAQLCTLLPPIKCLLCAWPLHTLFLALLTILCGRRYDLNLAGEGSTAQRQEMVVPVFSLRTSWLQGQCSSPLLHVLSMEPALASFWGV